ncbi:MAG TPA: SWIM zinc finger family protein [Candidatus Ozemobacteraceae bacterium]|mgnify:CR=1 FL=1|nr:SWIM zinc finger family protein [Candidatus Ozemobacteraceae bacterium]
MAGFHGYYYFPQYISVAQRKVQAEKARKKLEKSGRKLDPVTVTEKGRRLCRSWWGNAWTENLARFSDYDNRLPRGRSYLRNGAVIDLKIAKGVVSALVQGTRLYDVSIDIKPLQPDVWKSLIKDCSANITSLVDLMAGRFTDPVMNRLIRSGDGLFPEKKQISFTCSCPDYAGMCKHVAAAMMGIGVRFDDDPALFFKLRGVDPQEIITAMAGSLTTLDTAADGDDLFPADSTDLTAMFDIDLEPTPVPKPVAGKKAPSLPAASATKSVKPAKVANVAKPQKIAVLVKAKKAVKAAKPPKPAMPVRTEKPAKNAAKAKPAAPRTARSDVSSRFQPGVLMKSAELRAFGLTQAEIRRAFFDGNLEAGPARGEYVTNRKSLGWLQATCKH